MRKVILLLSLLLSANFVSLAQVRPVLGTTANFTVLAGTEIVSADSTVIYGNIGVAPNSTITGFPPGVVNGSQHAANAIAQTAKTDLATAYNQAAAQTPDSVIADPELGGKSLLPGVYRFNADASLNGTLTLDANGDLNGLFIIQVSDDFSAAAGSFVNLRNGARATNIFWQVADSVTIGTGANLTGTFLIGNSATLQANAQVTGRVMVKTGFVHLNRNLIDNPLPTADLSIMKTVPPDTFSRGQHVTFQIIVSNNGPRNETNVIVRDRLPSGLSYVSSSTTRASSYDPVTGIWAISQFLNGEVDTLHLVARVDTSGFVTNTASIAGSGIDSYQGNNTSSASFCAAPQMPGAINGPVSLCLDTSSTAQTYIYSVPPAQGATSYIWTLPSSWTVIGRRDTSFITVKPGTDTLSALIAVEAANSCGSSRASKILVYATNLPPGTPNAIAGPADVCIGATGLTYSVPKVWGASSYTWNVPNDWTITSGQGTASITVTAGTLAGAVSVRANNACGTSSAVNILVTPVGTPPATPGPIIGDSIVCQSATSISFLVPDVTNAKTYVWTVPAGWTILSGQNTNQISVKPATNGGVVTVYAQNACGNSGTATFNVSTTNSVPATPGTIIGNLLVCSGQQATYSIPLVNGASGYNWSIPTGWTIVSGQGTASITLRAGTAGGTISVAASNGCGTRISPTATITINAAPAMPGPITGDSIPCNGSLANAYSVASVTGATSYTWSVPAGWSILSGQGTASVVVSAGSSSGVLSVTAANACGNSAPRTLTVTPASVVPPAATRINGSLNICSGQSTLIYSVAPVAGASSYTWSVPAGWAITAGQGTTSITVTAGSTAGNITVTTKNGCGNGADASLSVVPATAPPAKPGIIAGQDKPCSGSANNTYTISAVTGAASYTWSVPSGWVITSGQGTTSITVIAASNGGNISVTANNACGSSTASVLSVNPSAAAPAIAGAISGNNIPCVGNTNNVYNINPVAGASSYNWSVPAGWQITSGQGTTSITITAGSSAGVISVTASNGCGTGPASIMAVTPASSAPGQPGAIIGDSLPCAGSTNAVYSINPVTGASTYNWSVPADWDIISGQGTASVTVEVGNSNGNISVTASNSCGTGTARVLVGNPVTKAPGKPLAILGDTAICGGSILTYSIPQVPNTSAYKWDLPVGWSVVSGDSTNIITVQAGNNAGQVSVTASNGCGTGLPSVLPVAVQALPGKPVIIAGDSIPCVNNQTTTYAINAVSNADSYTWSVPSGWSITAGQGTTAITVTPGIKTGFVTVKAENSCGNGPVDSLQVKPESVVPAIPLSIQGDSIPCVGSQTNAYVISPVAGASGYTWTVPADWTIVSGQGSTNVVVTVGTMSGFITVSATNGCGVGSAATMAVSPATTLPSIIGPIAGTTLTCAGQSGLTFSIAPVTSASSYNWTVPAGWTITNGQGTNAITVTAGNSAGTVAVTASNGCGTQTARTQAVNITTLAPPAPIVIYGDPVPCQGMQTATYRIDPVAAASTYTWTVPADWSITSGQGTTEITADVGTIPGTISVTASNTCGTSLATSFNVRSSAVTPVVPGPISGTTVACANDSTVIYQVAPLNTASGYTWFVPAGWQILTGDGTPTIRVKAGTTAGQVKVYAYNGCGSGDTSMLDVSIATSVPGTLGPIVGISDVCEGQAALIYSVDPEPDIAFYQWTVPAGWVITDGQGTTNITVTAGNTPGNITISAENGCGIGLTNEMPVSIKPLVAALGEIKNNSTACEGLTFEVDGIAGAENYTWTVPAGWTIVSGQGTTAIKVTSTATEPGIISVTAGNGNCNSTPVSIEANPKAGSPQLEFRNAFSPNNDGINDVWEIKNLQNYQSNELVIVNRWGNEVYKSQHYQNDWNGGNLSAGTYFYVMKVTMCDGSEESYKGYVMIVK